ncbi:MAG: DNA polymerase/3'-5' exonuclease PolX [Ignavibacteria bacterium]|nr:MAG: DNA polymerase/3'-5' exonuclease PolX [Ignavibacteria bacterium]
MTNKEVAAILDEIGTLQELNGENPFKSRAFHNASRVIGAAPKDLKELIAADELKEMKGIGSGIAEKIVELVESGKLPYYEKLKSSVPPGLLEMLRIPGLGPKRVKILYEKLGIKTIEQLRKAASEHRLGSIEGFGEKTEENILGGIEQVRSHADKHLYSKAREAVDAILKVLAGQKGVIRCEIAGSLRRRKEVIGDIDILASASRAQTAKIMESYAKHPDVEKIIAKGETKSSVILKSGINCDLRIIGDEEYPFALLYFTGSKEHNIEIRGLAKHFGWSLNEYAFSKLEDAKRVKRIPRCKTEEDIYKALNLSYIPPELRENMGEIDAARAGKIPVLIEETDLRGTFHCHSTYSDGANSIEEMARAAKALGWEYLGIADHSKIAAYAGGLTEERVKLQHKEIERLNGTLSRFRIFKGTEVDILADGTLDWSDRVLASFDFVVASVHSKFKMTESEATKRIIRAIRNKHVTMLGHSTGRLLLEREGYPVNMIDVIHAAADNGTIIEINAHPLRLDLDWRLYKYAKEKGVKISINPDAHNIGGLTDVRYGVGIARKGWLEKKDVINTRGADEVSKFLNH